MTADIANVLKGYVDDVGFADKVTGLVKVASVSDKNEAGQSIIRKYPISCDVSNTDCEKGKYLDLVPSKKYKSIMYFEDGGTSLVEDKGRFLSYSARLKLVGWLNANKLGSTLCSISGVAVAALIKKLPRSFFHSGIYRNMRIVSLNQDIKGVAIFSKYTYKEEVVQYLMYPYDYFALNITVEFDIPVDCLEDWEEAVELNCVENNQR